MSQSKKTLEFLQKLKDSGHWNEDYDYSEINYEKAQNKVIVIDKKFNTKHLIQASELLNGCSCTGSNLIDGYWNYQDSSNFIKNLKNGPKTYGEWLNYNKNGIRPHYIPSNPQRAFKSIWDINGGWGGFFGTGRKSDNLKNYPPFDEVKKEVQKHKFSSKREYEEAWESGMFPNFPKMIHNTYKDDFIDTADFLGIDLIRSKRRHIASYEEHQEYANINNLKSKTEWVEHFNKTKTLLEINSNPQRFFKDIWKERGGFPGFFKTSLLKNRVKGGYITYNELASLIIKNNITNSL
jgi:hypothetical protein